MMRIKEKNRYLIGVLIFLSILFCIWFFLLKGSRERRLINEGDKIVKKIETFRLRHNRLPISLKEIGIEEKDGGDALYYSIQDSASNNYMISFGKSLGESKIYYSDTKKWENFYRDMKK